MKIAIIAAMDKEVDLLSSLSSDSIKIYKSGIGKVASALKTAEVINNYHPDLIINSGVAGGLDTSLNIGDLVFGQDICYHDVWCGTPNAYGQVQGFPIYYHSTPDVLHYLDTNVKSGLIVSGDKFISDQVELSAIKNKFPQALAVDMESASIAQTCFIYNIPFVSLRLISDTPGSNHHPEQYDNFWKNAATLSFTHLKQLLQNLHTGA